MPVPERLAPDVLDPSPVGSARRRRRFDDLPMTRKLLIGMSFILFAVTMIGMVYLPIRQRESTMFVLRQGAVRTSALLALDVGTRLAVHDPDPVADALRWAREGPFIDYLAVYDTAGTPLAIFDPADVRLERPAAGAPTILERNGRLEAVAPVLVNGQPRGILLLGITLAPLTRQIAHARWWTLLALSLVFAAGILISLALARRIARPLVALRGAADELARGNFDVHVEVTSHDEVGALGSAFRVMVDALRDSMAQLAARSSELSASRDEALRAARTKAEFLAMMSHEIRTPLNGVIGMLGLLRGTPLDEEQRDYAATAHTSADALLTIINDILDFSKVEAGKLELERVVFSPGRIVEESLILLAERAHDKGIELASFCHPDVPTSAVGDPARLRQLLLNLVGNAIKFTAEGEVTLRVRLVRDDEQGALVRFDIADSGIGITDDQRSRLFQPFSQADASTTRRFGGTGLGLAICKRLVEAMGGEIGVESEPGLGSTFWFTLRLERATAPAATAIAVDRAAIAQLRVLVVDDNVTNRRILEHQMRMWGVAGGAAEDGPRALERLRDAATAGRPYHAAIVDMQMPGMDGVALTRVIRADPVMSATRILLLSSLSERVHEREARAAGVTRLLAKPVRESQLLHALDQVAADALGDARTACEPARAPTPAAVHAVRRDDAPHPAAPGMRLLLAEDNLVNQKVAAAVLARLGHQTHTVANGAEAVEAVRSERFDAVLMDCQMPIMDGLEATRRIRALEAGSARERVPIIAMTANAMQGDREHCLAAGMDDYVSKPIDPSVLATTLERWLGRDEGAGSSPGEWIVARPRVTGEFAAFVVGGARAASVATPPSVHRSADVPPIRLAKLEALVGHDRVTIRNYLALFTSVVDGLVAGLSDATRERNVAEIRRLSHQVRGSAASIGADALADASATLERLAVESALEPADRSMTEIVSAYAHVRTHIASL